MVDARHYLACRAANPEADDQIAFADVVVVNKADLTDAEALRNVIDQIRRVNGSAELHRTVRGAVEPEQLFGRRAYGFERLLAGIGVPSAAQEHRHGAGVRSVSLVADQPLDAERFHRWIVSLSASRQPDLLRIKGILDLAGENRRYAFQAVQAISGGEFVGSWPVGEPRRSRLVLIGRELDAAALQRSFIACELRRGRSTDLKGQAAA